MMRKLLACGKSLYRKQLLNRSSVKNGERKPGPCRQVNLVIECAGFRLKLAAMLFGQREAFLPLPFLPASRTIAQARRHLCLRW